MKISQILKENTIDPDYTPNQYTLEQIEVIEFEDFENKSKNYHALKSDQEVIDLGAWQLEKYTKIFKFNPTPDWDRSAYYKNEDSLGIVKRLLLVYPGIDDSSLAIITRWNDDRSSTYRHIQSIYMAFSSYDWYNRQIDKAKEDKII